MEKIMGILLAAGYSSRMGKFKPLLPVCGLPALERGIRCLLAAGLPVTVVTGHRHEELSPLITRLGAAERYNPDYDTGMFSSVQAGISASLGMDGAVLMPCDCAAVPPEAVKQLIACAGDRGEYALPTYEGKNGHPLFIPGRYFEEILRYTGPGGLKGARELHRDRLLRLPMPYPGTLPDMDTKEDYEALCRSMAYDGLDELICGRRFLLVRHGATELHSGKVIMGRYDARLSDIGRQQMRELGEKLSLTALHTDSVYFSPQSRAADSAAILNETLQRTPVPVSAFREISLGAWDGLLIDEVKRRWPQEYARRGEYLMGYRFDGDSESFYEVEYRVRKGLIDLLQRDSSPDILIVSHAGAIKCLYGVITGIGIDRAFHECRPEKGQLTVVSSPGNTFLSLP